MDRYEPSCTALGEALTNKAQSDPVLRIAGRSRETLAG